MNYRNKIKISLLLVVSLFLTSCSSEKYVEGSQGASMVILNAYGLEYYISENLIDVDIPAPERKETLYSYTHRLVDTFHNVNNEINVGVIIDTYAHKLIVDNCNKGCILSNGQTAIIKSIDGEVSTSLPTYPILDCKSNLAKPNDGFKGSPIYSREKLSIDMAVICGRRF